MNKSLSKRLKLKLQEEVECNQAVKNGKVWKSTGNRGHGLFREGLELNSKREHTGMCQEKAEEISRGPRHGAPLTPCCL